MKRIIITTKDSERDGKKTERLDIESENCSPTDMIGLIEHARAILRASAIRSWNASLKDRQE